MRVAPFKAQNMANNAFATREGGEIGVAQAVQAEACGLLPRVEMNPILLKPNGPDGSQIVRLGVAGETVAARQYYETIEDSWRTVSRTLDGWNAQCDVLVMEGAGSPVELNLMSRDIVNLRPIEYTDGRWVLVSNIEYGGVFAQVLGTWGLLPEGLRKRGLGALVNRFRGDLGLFEGAKKEFEERMTLPYLGCMPFDSRLRIDDEDSLNSVISAPSQRTPYFAWVKYPQVANSQDLQPWIHDEGIQNVWTRSLDTVRKASAIVLPGSKNTLADLHWLKETGLAGVICEAAASGKPIVGICGGKQMLGERLCDPSSGEWEDGLGLLPLETEFSSSKRVIRNQSRYEDEVWETFEIHTGCTIPKVGVKLKPLLESGALADGVFAASGVEHGNVWGTYQHGIFDSPAMRERFLSKAGLREAVVCKKDWRDRRSEIYTAMADALERYLCLDTIKSYLQI